MWKSFVLPDFFCKETFVEKNKNKNLLLISEVAHSEMLVSIECLGPLYVYVITTVFLPVTMIRFPPC